MIRPPVQPPTVSRKPSRTRVVYDRNLQRTRIFYDRNLTPIGIPNPWYTGPGGGQPDAQGNGQLAGQPDHAEYCEMSRLRRAFGLYEGTFHRALTWWNNGQFTETDWGREQNNLEPVNAEALDALADLVEVAPFTEPADKLIPIFIDIETLADFHQPQPVLDLAQAFKTRLPNSEVWWYFSSIQADPALAKSHGPALAEILDSGMFSFYCWDAVADSNGRTIWADIRHASNLIERCFPGWERNKVATICPVWTINYGGALESLNGQPVPISLWSEIVDFLVEDGWELMFWLSGTRYTSVAPHIDYLARYAR